MKNYLYIPIMMSTISEHTRPAIFSALHAAKADYVFLSSENLFYPSKMEKDIARLRTEIPLFEKEGFTVAVWINSFGFGLPLDQEAKKQGWTKIKGIYGRKTDSFCPTDKKFRAYYARVLTSLVKAGAKIVLLDDDYCLSIRPDVGCSCKTHSRLLRKKTRLPLPGAAITAISVFGKPGRFRKQWLEVMGGSLLDFAREMRSAVDKTDPNVRLGLCAGYTSWDWEGADAYEIAKALAGKNKPFLRLTGAPYWIYTRRFGNQSLVDIIECTRMQIAWLKEKDVEVFAEDDSYPRPCYHVPAAYLEALDTVVRAQGGCGTLKYMFDYNMFPDTENGYKDSHKRTLSIYPTIDRLFGGKEDVGVRVYEYARKAALSYTSLNQNNIMERTFFSRAATMLGNAGIPTKYEGDGIGVCFGPNAFYLPESALKDGLILDYPAALKLTLSGVDVGLPRIKGDWYDLLKKTPKLSSSSETDEETGERNAINNTPIPATFPLFVPSPLLYAVEPKQEAKILSRYDNGSPSSYLYENKDGQRFLVYLFESASVPFDSDLLLSYPRSRQLKKAIPYLHKKPLAAYVDGNVSGVYMMTKKEGKNLSLGLWNTRPDTFSFSVAISDFLSVNQAPDNVSANNNGVWVKDMPPYSSLFLSVTLR